MGGAVSILLSDFVAAHAGDGHEISREERII